MGPSVKTIVIEEHFSTEMQRRDSAATEFRNFYLTSRSAQIGHSIVDQLADIDEQRIAFMDKSGVDVQVLSVTSPGPQALVAAEAIPFCTDANERLYETVQRHPGRFAGFAALPTDDPKAAADELERTVTQLGFKGTMIHGHTRGEFLDERRFWPIFERAEALDVPIYLHPALPHPGAVQTYFEGYELLARAGWGFAIDCSCHFLRIVFAGVFDAYPKLKIILGHLGEGIPFAMHRLNEHTYAAAKQRGLRKTPLEYLQQNMLVTTSGNWFEPAFVCTMMALGADNILFAIDWPFEANATGMDFFRRLPISDADKEKIAHLNAERILKM
jgi:predicted TIM-barrel fold metal-dependent hydrolase